LIEKWGNRKPEIGSREYCPKNNYRKNQKTSSNKKGIHFSISKYDPEAKLKNYFSKNHFSKK